MSQDQGEIKVSVPLTAFDLDWVERELMDRAEAAGGQAEEGDEEGKVMTYYVEGLSADQVAATFRDMISGPGFQVTVVDGEVLVSRTTADLLWLKPLGPVDGTYDRAVKKLCKTVPEDEQWTSWWSQAPFEALLVQSVSTTQGQWDFTPHQGDLLVHAAFADLALMDQVKPDRRMVAQGASDNVREVLTRTGTHLRLPPPPPWQW